MHWIQITEEGKQRRRVKPWSSIGDHWKQRRANHVKRGERVPRCVRRGCAVSSALCPYRTPSMGLSWEPLLDHHSHLLLLLGFGLPSLASSSCPCPSAFSATHSAPSNSEWMTQREREKKLWLRFMNLVLSFWVYSDSMYQHGRWFWLDDVALDSSTWFVFFSL